MQHMDVKALAVAGIRLHDALHYHPQSAEILRSLPMSILDAYFDMHATISNAAERRGR